MVTFSDWYWIVGGDTANVWSSKRAMSVPVADPEYVNWLTAYATPSSIPTMAELESVFAVQYPRGSLNTYCAYVRWQKESGGMTLMSGMKILTDDRSKARINSVMNAAAANAQFKTMWHAADHTVQELDKPKIQAMSNEINAWIDNAFNISADVLSQIAAGTITTHEQIDSAFGLTATAQKSQRQIEPWSA